VDQQAAFRTDQLKGSPGEGSTAIYGEVPGECYRSVLDAYRNSAVLVEQSDLDFTILRPAGFTHDEAID
jgi:hypothetical protein